MSHRTGEFGKVVTVLRGDALRDARGVGVPSTASPKPDAASTIYGVPVSAVQHCCGRGCKHCQIYWHRMKP